MLERIANLRRFRDPRRAWQRLVLYSKRLSPRLSWRDDLEFSSLWERARPFSLSDVARAQTLYQLARHAVCLDGAFAEVGVYRGGTARLLAEVAGTRGRELHLFDTFQGMPKTDPARDLHTEGDFADTSIDSVKRLLVGCRGVFFHEGEFPTTARPVEGELFSLVHVDVDIASAVEACCSFFYPRMVAGGVLVFDDYGFTSCPGAKAAADAFFAKRPEPLLPLMTSQAIVLRQA